MFKVASLNGNNVNQILLSMNNLVEGNIHGGVINNTTGTKQNVIFIVGTAEFPFRVEANSTTGVSKINVPTSTIVQVNAPTGVNISVSYIETASDASSALTTVQELVNEANTSATNASISEANANTSAINANSSAENANESETNASNSEIMANKWAVNPEDMEVLTGQFSAYHWARKAQAVASGDVIDDGVVSDLLTWSSTKISDLIIDRVGLIEYGYVAKSYHIVAFGGVFNRADYPKLWAYLQANPTLVKTQAQWTTEATANGGICGFFSDGNGTTTFRVPNLDKAFLRPDSRGVGSYQEGSYTVGDDIGTSSSGLINFDSNTSLFRERMNWDNLSTVNKGDSNLKASFVVGSASSYALKPTNYGVTRPKNIAVLPLIVAK